MIRVFILSLAVLLAPLGAFAQQSLGEFKDWGVFKTTENANKVCYITSNPIKQTGNYKKKGEVYILVTYRGGDTVPEISVDTGFSYKKDSELEFNIDDKASFKFFTSEKTPQMSWGKDAQMDQEAISAMKRGNKIITKATSKRGTNAQDTYSLKGFTAAYEKMTSICK